MQPQEPVAGPTSQPPQPPQARGPMPVSGAGAVLPPPVGVPGKRPNRRGRLILAMVAGVIGLLCLGGVGVFVSLYDEATEIKRSAPDAVVDNFLGAYLVNRDDNEAELYECKSGGDLAELEAYRADIIDREKIHSVGITVSWGSFDVSTNGAQGTVSTDLTKGTSNGNERITKPWRFDVVDQDGWRVCGATQTVP
ncbi:hypothetical protein [Paractinoplanes toevensis]|uniref:hypothetical protein n=1 Tax=Paractinoplanes toevensis TaxID=571911 RepID=UPI001FEAF1EA|nr:hypothetical protein [Actinoplanes toevensis]